MNELIDACRPVNISRVAGSGNKFIHILDQKSDYYINLVPGFKYWDMCASEALMQAKMGIVTDANQRPLLYDHTKENFTIREGIIVAKNKKVFDLCKHRIETNLGKDISSFHKVILEDSNRRRAQRGDTKQSKVIQLNPEVFSEQDIIAQKNAQILAELKNGKSMFEAAKA